MICVAENTRKDFGLKTDQSDDGRKWCMVPFEQPCVAERESERERDREIIAVRQQIEASSLIYIDVTFSFVDVTTSCVRSLVLMVSS